MPAAPREDPEPDAAVRSERSTGSELHAIALLGLLLRVAVHHGRSFDGDELGSLVFLERDYGYLLSHFEAPLTMNWFLVLVKGLTEVLGDGHWALVVPSLAGGIASIYLLHRLAARFFGRVGAALAALLVACCPTFVEASVELRSYALFNALVLAALLAALSWLEARRWRSANLCALAATLALLMHPNALYPLCFVGLWVGLDLVRDRRRWPSLAIPMAVAAVLVLAAYAPLREGMRAYRAEWTVPPPAQWNYLPELARRWFGTGWLALPALGLASLGLWSAVRERSRVARFGLGVLVPLCVSSLMGVDTIVGAYPRFLSPILPMLLVLVVAGIEVVARRAPFTRIACSALVLACWVPQLAHAWRARHETPLSAVTSYLSAQPRPSDVLVIGSNVERSFYSERTRSPDGAFATWYRDRDLVRGILFVVSSGPPIVTRAPARVFGELQVVSYDAPSQLARVRLLHADLLATVEGFPIDGELAGHYGALMSSASALGLQQELLRYTVYYYESFLRTKRCRDLPGRLLEVRTTLSTQPILKDLLRNATPSALARE